MGNKYSNVLTIGLIAGIVIILLGVCVAGFFMMRNNKLDQENAEAVEQYQKNVKKNNETTKENKVKENVESDVIVEPAIKNEVIVPIITETNTIADNNSNTDNNTKKVSTYKGFPMVGTIEIPSINLSSPVLEASKDSMKVAVVIYDGPGLNKVGNTTIAGHNYKDGRFFSNIKQIKEGDKIYITSENGEKVTYEVYKAPYITNREDITYLERNTEERREVTLIGCTDDVQNIYVVWAKESK